MTKIQQGMKVLMQIRHDAFTKIGGDTIQMLNTAKELKKLGVYVDISTSFMPDISKYDIIHVFNLETIEYSYFQILNAKKYNKPVAFSVIYWELNEQKQKQMMSSVQPKKYSELTKWAKNNAHYIVFLPYMLSVYAKIKNDKRYKCPEFFRLASKLGIKTLKKMALLNADILLPNSYTEIELLFKNFNIKKDFMKIVNGVNSDFQTGNPDSFKSKYKIDKEFALCVARIEQRKNQLKLIQAVKNTNIPLVLVGRGEEPYFTLCKKSADSNVTFIGPLNSKELANAYKAAKVHILPSWLETPGLASLEAALAGCVIVSTKYGSTEEYFKDTVFYCIPDSIESIRDALIKGWNSTPSHELIDLIKREYTWQQAAIQTLAAYNKILFKS
ncbi:MAG: glycosyltransferase [bacterium]